MSFISGVLSNKILIAAFCGWLVAQVLKTIIYVAVNTHWEDHYFEIPRLPEGFTWRLAFDSKGYSSESGNEKKISDQNGIMLGARTTMILVGR